MGINNLTELRWAKVQLGPDQINFLGSVLDTDMQAPDMQKNLQMSTNFRKKLKYERKLMQFFSDRILFYGFNFL